MLISPLESRHPLPLAGGACAVSPSRPSDIECEVVDLFDQLRTPVLRYVISLGLSVHDGEEIIQEVFLALFRHLQSGKSRQNLRSWIFRVAHNLALKQHLANNKARTLFAADEAAAQWPDAAPNPEEQATINQRLKRMQAVVCALPEQDRCCLNLRAEGLRYREIAAALGISLGSVSISLTRSVARLICADGRSRC